MIKDLLYLILYTLIISLVFRRLFMFYEYSYVKKYRKPLYRSFVIFKSNLDDNSKSLLTKKFLFYRRLSDSQKRLFEHRLVRFIKHKDFIGREGLDVTQEMKLLIGATAVMLTFGYRHFLISIVSKIIIYPDTFYSKINNNLHKGEFNPKLKTLVLSWKHFKEGYDIGNDNLNLGIHEFTHAIHIDGIYKTSINSAIFNEGYKELKSYLDSNEDVKAKLIASEYLRDYAYTNQFEFIAVIIETFIETPSEFKQNFPALFHKVKVMLNFKISLC